jgi:hypothetical protein
LKIVIRVAAAALALASAVLPPAAAPAKRPPAGPTLAVLADRLVLTTAGYRLTLDRASGKLLDLVALPGGTRLVRGQLGCLWRAETSVGAPVDACATGPVGFRWEPGSGALTLTSPTATATIRARRSFLDLSLRLQNAGDSPLSSVDFPADLVGGSAAVKAGYVPTYLPGLRLRQRFFRGTNAVALTYPGRWAFADYLAFDAGRSSLALYTVNPPPNPIQPAELGFVRAAPPGDCSGDDFCVRHRFETWLEPGASWSSPVVRLRIGQTPAQTIVAYRHDNGIDAYPSLEEKTGSALGALAQAPLIKADLEKGVPFGDWAAELGRLPSPALIHPVSFQPGAFDANDPDFLPPDPLLGTTADLRAAVEHAHARGQLVMPYLNASWWSLESPTLAALPDGVTPDELSVLNRLGKPRLEAYGARTGYVVSPFAAYVRQRFATMLDEWRADVPVDCVFFDQIGARPWLRDFNPSAPSPLAYEDGWLGLLAPYAKRCVMVEDGWDRLASVAAGFSGGLLLMERAYAEPDSLYGPGNWEPYPLALWLLHDKVLLYQHDLYEPTMTADPEALTWSLAFGFMLSYDWNALTDSLAGPWLDVAASFQRTLGPLYAGQPLTSFATIAPGVTRTSFGSYSVLANWSTTDPYGAGADEVAPGGFLAQGADGAVRAGAFSRVFSGAPLSAGTHYLVVERTPTSVAVHQPLGDATELSIELPAAWTPGSALAATAGGAAVGGRVEGRRFVFRCLGPADGKPAPTYLISTGSK